ncbi:MAG: undecaprenyl/decaprenyl-phosphate alpha-N-acetylglucosaminyl 1-phosphate transferase [Elusimicrobia bacterium]|nr:undecaprenyl/decaprenyl-phosphate alpha-N-acetylglucosaminyl 1-phosphate transferase [Elusimicrobiota bacterium]
MSARLPRRYWLFSIICLCILLPLMPKGGISALSWETGLRWLYLFLIAFFTTVISSPLIIKLAHRYDLLDRPDARKMHKTPIPRIGGAAMFLAVWLVFLRNMVFSTELCGIMAGSSVVFILGMLDNLLGLSSLTRLFWQIAGSLIVVISGVRFDFPMHWPGGFYISAVLSVLWLVGIINAFNFMDGIDGLAAGLGTASSLILMAVGIWTGQRDLVFLAASLSGACLGFLLYNWHPAVMFMGDGGSTWLGFLLGACSLWHGWATNKPLVSFGAPLILLGIPIFDIIYITVSRIRRGVVRSVRQWLDHVDKDHFHHRLLKLGFTIEQAVAFLVLLNICMGINALVLVRVQSNFTAALMVLQSTLLFIIVALVMIRRQDDCVSLEAPSKTSETPK